jgi:hypothetical protein
MTAIANLDKGLWNRWVREGEGASGFVTQAWAVPEGGRGGEGGAGAGGEGRRRRRRGGGGGGEGGGGDGQYLWVGWSSKRQTSNCAMTICAKCAR